jgi:hypothetical protein
VNRRFVGSEGIGVDQLWAALKNDSKTEKYSVVETEEKKQDPKHFHPNPQGETLGDFLLLGSIRPPWNRSETP